MASVTRRSAVALTFLFAREKGQVENPCPHSVDVGNPHQAVGTMSGLPGGAAAVWRHAAWRGWRSSQHAHTAAGEGPGSWRPALGGGGKPERNAKTGTTQGGQAGEGALMEARSPWLPWWEGGKESLPLRSLIRQILLVAHQGSAARSCASFDPDLRVSGTGLISAPARGDRALL